MRHLGFESNPQKCAQVSRSEIQFNFEIFISEYSFAAKTTKVQMLQLVILEQKQEDADDQRSHNKETGATTCILPVAARHVLRNFTAKEII